MVLTRRQIGVFGDALLLAFHPLPVEGFEQSAVANALRHDITQACVLDDYPVGAGWNDGVLVQRQGLKIGLEGLDHDRYRRLGIVGQAVRVDTGQSPGRRNPDPTVIPRRGRIRTAIWLAR